MSSPYTDKYGNKAWVADGNNLYIKLKKSRKKRLIGYINDLSRTLHVTRTRKQVSRELKAYGFNYSILQKTNRFDTIQLDDAKGIYRIPVSVILDEGQFLHSHTYGFAVQTYLSLDRIINFKIK